jgi:hypothetical protein
MPATGCWVWLTRGSGSTKEVIIIARAVVAPARTTEVVIETP